jgi:hypothetical protein
MTTNKQHKTKQNKTKSVEDTTQRKLVTIKISAKFHTLIYRLPPNITLLEEKAKLEEPTTQKTQEKKPKHPQLQGQQRYNNPFPLATDYHSCNNNNNNNNKKTTKITTQKARLKRKN